MNVRPWLGRDIVLDTNVLIHLGKYTITGEWLLGIYCFNRREMAPIISAVSVAEALTFAEANKWSLRQNETLRRVIGKCIVRDVTADDLSLIDSYKTIDIVSRGLGRRMGKNDLWIAAECRRMGAVLLTSDNDFCHLHEKELIVDLYAKVASKSSKSPMAL